MTKDCCVTDETLKKDRRKKCDFLFDIHCRGEKVLRDVKLDRQVLSDLETKPALDVNNFYQTQVMRASNIAKTCST